jgi:hypothetical protein
MDYWWTANCVFCNKWINLQYAGKLPGRIVPASLERSGVLSRPCPCCRQGGSYSGAALCARPGPPPAERGPSTLGQNERRGPDEIIPNLQPEIGNCFV